VARCAAAAGASADADGGVDVRPAADGDLDALAALSLECAPEGGAGWSRSQLAEELARPDGLAVVLLAQRPPAPGRPAEAAGFAVGWRVAGEMQVLELAVGRGHRRRGVGGALLAALLAAGACERQPATLEVREDNASALYAAQGFAAVSRRPRYYADGAAALLMERPPGGCCGGGSGDGG